MGCLELPDYTYLWGEDGLLAETNSSGTYLALQDGNKNIMGYVDASDGSSVADYEYSPFGQQIASTGTMADAFNFKFSSYYTDDETDLVYYGYRYYDADMGRWLNRDPKNELGFRTLSGFNKRTRYETLYGFVQNDSINKWDNLGLSSIDLIRKLAGQKLKKSASLSVGATVVGVGGFNIGAEAAFFPDTCEIGLYKILPGTAKTFTYYKSKDVNHVNPFKALKDLILDTSWGAHISAGIFLSAQGYVGNEDAGAGSYEGYFYGVSGSYSVFGGGIFWDGDLLNKERKWYGAKIGIGPPGAGISYDAVFYKQIKEYGSPIQLEKLPGGKCLCYALTAVMP